MIAQKMEQAGIRNKEAYLRKMSVDGFVIALDLSEVKEVVRLLRIVSNNLNQIARHVNETGSIYETDILDLRYRYGKLWETANGILHALADIRAK